MTSSAKRKTSAGGLKEAINECLVQVRLTKLHLSLQNVFFFLNLNNFVPNLTYFLLK